MINEVEPIAEEILAPQVEYFGEKFEKILDKYSDEIVYKYRYNNIDYFFTEQQIQFQQLFQNDLFLTTKYLCGFNEKYVTGPKEKGGLDYPMLEYLHGTVCYIIQYSPWTRLLFMMPRGTFKSSIVSVGFVIWNIIKAPSARIALGTYTETQYKKFIKKQEGIIEGKTSNIFPLIFPHLTPLKSASARGSDWSARTFTVNREFDFKESTVTGIPCGSTVENAHYDIVIGDDLVTEENHDSERKMEDVISFAHNFNNLLANPSCQILIDGTTWDIADLYALLRNEEGWSKLIIPIPDNWETNGNWVFGEKYTVEALRKLRNNMDDKEFSSNYLLNPISVKRAFMSQLPFVKYKEIFGEN